MEYFYFLRILTLTFLSLSIGNEAKNKVQQDPKIEVMLLGVYHFDNPGKDKHNLTIDDYFDDHRQKEINEVVQRLALFGPNKIFIEQKPESQERIDSLYLEYSNDRLDLKSLERGRNEIFQLGFKLAKKQDLEKLYCIDANGNWLGPYADFIADTLDLDFYRKDETKAGAGIQSINEQFRKNSVKENLVFTNQPEGILDNHNYYIDVAMRVKDTVGIYFTNQNTTQVIDGKEYLLRSFDFENIGVELATEWYKRNFFIYRNILENSRAGDRLLIIFGQGHMAILQNLLKDNPRFKLVSPLDYLQAE